MSLETSSKDYLKEEEMAKILNLAITSSPYLKRLIKSEEDLISEIKSKGFYTAYKNILSSLEELSYEIDSIKVRKSLRIFKKRASLLIALGDLSGIFDLSEVTKFLSILADKCLDSALSHLLKKYAQEGKISLKDDNRPLSDCGITIIGMGKLGAYELNYSSDIDLIYLFDAQKIKYFGNKEIGDFMIKFAKELTSLIEQRDKDGYVFRVDLRIRPDPLSTPIIMTVNAAENYYESFGQNWERAAMIKARAVAGDLTLGKEFISRIYPFVWRRSLDFKAINDIKDIKKQISSRLQEEKEFKGFGYNIKLGKGGIRDIEFFVQVQQLIWGGRCKSLQVSDTLSALSILNKEGYISNPTANELKSAYIFFRNLEHRLQMINDEQTHKLPINIKEFDVISLLMGFEKRENFLNILQTHLNNSSREFSKYFFDAKSNKEGSKLIFSGEEDNKIKIKEISNFGFSNPEIISNAIISWTRGLYTSTRSKRVQEVLPNFLPSFLGRLSKTENPDRCFYEFDDLLRSLPSGIQLISLLDSRPEVMEIVIKIIDSAALLTKTMKKYPAVIEDLINSDFFLPLKDKASLSKEVQTLSSFESSLSNLQLWVNSKKFQAGVHLLTGLADGLDIGVFISEVASTAANKTAFWLEENFIEEYGKIPSGKISFLLLGRNGSGEAMLNSDLDIIFIYDAPEEGYSDGGKQLDIKRYYSRFIQRYLNTLTSIGKNGRIWEVDMRLRPSGNSGPLATSLSSFIKYQKEEAWTWEHMALTKARVIYGDLSLEGIIKDILSQERDNKKLKEDIILMREKMTKEHRAKSYLDLKLLPGGMTDIEFIAQYFQLAYSYKAPNLLQKNTLDTIKISEELSILDSNDALFLINFYTYMMSLRSLYSLNFNLESNLPTTIKKRLATIAKVRDLKELERKILEDSQRTQKIFKDIFHF